MILHILIVSTKLVSLLSVSYFEHLIDTYALFAGKTSNLLGGRKNRNMIAFRFLKEHSNRKAPLQTRVVYSSGGSKRKIGPIFRETVI